MPINSPRSSAWTSPRLLPGVTTISPIRKRSAWAVSRPPSGSASAAISSQRCRSGSSDRSPQASTAPETRVTPRLGSPPTPNPHSRAASRGGFAGQERPTRPAASTRPVPRLPRLCLSRRISEKLRLQCPLQAPCFTFTCFRFLRRSDPSSLARSPRRDTPKARSRPANVDRSRCETTAW